MVWEIMASDISVLDDFKDQVLSEMINQGIDKSKAETIAVKLREHIRVHWGGQQIYFTVKGSIKERNAEIYRRYDGKNRVDLTREYGISQQYFYQIIKAEHTKKRKPITG